MHFFGTFDVISVDFCQLERYCEVYLLDLNQNLYLDFIFLSLIFGVLEFSVSIYLWGLVFIG